MISYKQAKFKSLEGEYKGVIVDAETERNNYYDPSKENSTDYVLNLTLSLEDPEGGDSIPFTQKYIAPLVGGKSLFQQLLDLKDVITDLEGGTYNEQDLVGSRVVVTFGKNKKGYATIEQIRGINQVVEKLTKKPIQENYLDDLPADKKDLPFS